jgi:hypothetical protein
MGKGIRWYLLLLAGLVSLGLAYLGYSADPKVTALRNVVHYKAVKALGGPVAHTDRSPGALAGSIRDAAGQPVPGATVLVSSPLGHAYTAEADSEGHYQIAGVPPGCYVPVAGKQGFEDALNQTCLAGLCYRPCPGRKCSSVLEL